MHAFKWLFFLWAFTSPCRGESIVISEPLDWETLGTPETKLLNQQAKHLGGTLLDASYHNGTGVETFAMRVPIHAQESRLTLDQVVASFLQGAATHGQTVHNQQPTTVKSLKGVRIASQFTHGQHTYPVLTYLLSDHHQLYVFFFLGITSEYEHEVLLHNYFARLHVSASSSPDAAVPGSDYSTGERLGTIISRLNALEEQPGTGVGLVGHGVVSEETIGLTFTLEEALRDYRKDFGCLPSGTNRTIVRTLLGLNPKQKVYYHYLDTRLRFDRQGNLLDLWHEPFQFTLHARRAKVYSRRYQSTINDKKQKAYKWQVFPPIPDYTKQQLAQSACYELALGVRLLTQQRHRVPPSSQLAKLLFDSPNESDGIIGIERYPGDFDQTMTDPWGSPYKIKLSKGEVSVWSIHTSYVATERLEPNAH